ncbi:hypothetical protein L0Z66_11805 [Phaeobacter sp. BS34]
MRNFFARDREPILTPCVFLTDLGLEQTGGYVDKEMNLLGSLLRYSSLPLSLINPEAEELELSFVNPAFEKATGYRAEDVLDRPCPLFDGLSGEAEYDQ